MSRVWMIAEDDPVIRCILKMLMTLWEVDTLVFEDGHQAWAWLDRVERGEIQSPMPEIALLDIRMPGHLGYEVGQRMRAIPETSQIPQIIMTAYRLGKEDKEEIMAAARPEQLIQKPFPAPDDFLDLINRTIAASQTRRKQNPAPSPTLRLTAVSPNGN